jgi:hypothetical protein
MKETPDLPTKQYLLDVTMTATIRPQVLARTLQTFSAGLFKPILDNVRLIINIDRIGIKADALDVVDTARSYIPSLTCRITAEPNFGRAFCWCWSMITAPWTFNLEDDWELQQPVDIKAMIATMEAEPDLANLCLPYNISTAAGNKRWNLFFPWNGRYFECPEDLKQSVGFCGHPSLIRSEFALAALRCLNPNLNPEKQFHQHNGPMNELTAGYRFGVWGKPGDPSIVRDLGRNWMVENGLAKQGNKAFFTQWEKSQGGN